MGFIGLYRVILSFIGLKNPKQLNRGFTDVALEGIRAEFLDDIPALLACFPNICSLRLNLWVEDWDDRDMPIDLLGAALARTSVRILDIAIGKIQDLQILGAVVAALPFLQRLTLRLWTLESILFTSEWLTKSPRDFSPKVSLSVRVIYPLCQPTGSSASLARLNFWILVWISYWMRCTLSQLLVP